jgi:hypothetical protein
MYQNVDGLAGINQQRTRRVIVTRAQTGNIDFAMCCWQTTGIRQIALQPSIEGATRQGDGEQQQNRN